MQTARLPRFLRRLALAAILLGVGIWLFGGRRVGWTQTNIVEMKVDPVTELTYPERREAFVAGIEFPAVGLAAGLGLLTLAWLTNRRHTT